MLGQGNGCPLLSLVLIFISLDFSADIFLQKRLLLVFLSDKIYNEIIENYFLKVRR